MEAGPGRPIRIRHCSSSWVLCKPVFRDPLMADRSQIRLRTALPRPRNFLHNRAEHSNCENNPHEVHRQSSPVPISTNSRVAGGASGEVCETAQQDWMVTVFPLHGLSESLRLVGPPRDETTPRIQLRSANRVASVSGLLILRGLFTSDESRGRCEPDSD